MFYNPSEVTFEELCDVFFDRIDPTTVNGQGNDRGTQYRTGIYPHTKEQEAAVRLFPPFLAALLCSLWLHVLFVFSCAVLCFVLLLRKVFFSWHAEGQDGSWFYLERMEFFLFRLLRRFEYHDHSPQILVSLSQLML